MNDPATILLVDDEVAIQRTVGLFLRSRGYDVETAGSGADALRRILAYPPDLVVLDLGLPDIDGIEVCQRVRGESAVPIVVLSARSSEADKVGALEGGADDYLTKPFAPEELIARIRVVLRRQPAIQDQRRRLVVSGLTIDYERRRVLRDGEEIRLTPKEFRLLTLLAEQPGRVLTHRVLLKSIWGPHAVDEPEHLWVLVGLVRKKIERDPAQPRFLISEPCLGYRFCDHGVDER